MSLKYNTVFLGFTLLALIGSASVQLVFNKLAMPSVPEISTTELLQLQAELASLVAQSTAVDTKQVIPKFVLVDVRDPVEYTVSVIPGAISAAQFETNKAKHRDQTVICYCTVGYRSAIYAKKLIADGLSAMNYKGSIMAWCAANLPLETLERQLTNRVHTYDASYRVPSSYEAIW